MIGTRVSRSIAGRRAPTRSALVIDQSLLDAARDATRKWLGCGDHGDGSELDGETAAILNATTSNTASSGKPEQLVRMAGSSASACDFKVTAPTGITKKPSPRRGSREATRVSHRSIRIGAPRSWMLQQRAIRQYSFYEPTFWIIGGVTYHRSHCTYSAPQSHPMF